MVAGRMSDMGHLPGLPRFRRILATGCVALVFALGIFAVSPALHEQLHRGDTAAVDDGCAVALFATGVVLLLSIFRRPPVVAEWHELAGIARREIHLDSPRYLLQPERAPPLS
jgi:hypothetical protein